MSASIRKFIDELEPEQRLLSQLIYRNHNQHGATQLLSYFKGLNRVLKLLTTEKLNFVNSKCELGIRASAQGKLTSLDLKQLFESQDVTTAAVNMLSEAIEITFQCADCVRRLLLKRLFLPLYTMFLAITARILGCLTGIHHHFYTQNNMLSSQLKHISVVQPRLEKLIGEHLESTRVAYSPLTSDVLHRIQSAETPVPLQLQDAGSKFLNHNISNDGRKRGDISSTSTTKKAPGALAASRLNVSTTSLLSAASTAYSGNEVNCNVNSGDSNVDDADKDGDWEDAGLFIAECETPALSTVSGSGSFSSSRDIAAARGGAMPPPASVRGAVSNVVVATFSSGDSKSAQSTVVVENHSYTDFDRLFSDSSNSNSGGGGKQQSSAATTLQETAGLLNKAAEKLPKKAKKRDREVETGASAFRAEKAAKKQSNSAIKEVNINVKKKSKKSSNRSSGGGKEDDIDNIFGGL